jgi:hypothetical protein
MLRSCEYFILPGLTSFYQMFTPMTCEVQCRHRADSISATRVIHRNTMQTLQLAMAGMSVANHAFAWQYKNATRMTEALLMYEDEGVMKPTFPFTRGVAFPSGQSRKWPPINLNEQHPSLRSYSANTSISNKSISNLETIAGVQMILKKAMRGREAKDDLDQ